MIETGKREREEMGWCKAVLTRENEMHAIHDVIYTYQSDESTPSGV